MANICTTDYCFYGNKDAVKKFKQDIDEFTSKNYKENGFGTSWLGNVVLGYGFPYEGNDFEFRGNIEGMYMEEDDDDKLFISTSNPWYPKPEMWDAIIDKHFTNVDGGRELDYVFVAEEPGFEVYINTDTEGTIFPDRYVLYVGGIPENEDNEMIILESDEQLISTVNRIFNVENSTIEETFEFVRKRAYEVYEENEDASLALYKYESEY